MRSIFYGLACVLSTVDLCQGSQLTSIEQALSINNIEIPNIDLSESTNNEIAYLGNFEDLNFYKYTGQQNFTEGIESMDDRLIYYSNGTFISLYSPEDEGNSTVAQINRIIPFGEDSFILSGEGSILGHQLDHQILFNISTLQYEPIFNQSISNINDVLVDDDIVYFGGEFEYKVSNETGHGVVLWNSTTGYIELLPFRGFGSNSVVNSILKLDDNNILFAGRFNTLDETELLQQNQGTNNSNFSSIEFSQQVSLKYAQWSSEGSLNLDDMICPLSNNEDGWTSSGSSAGSFTVTLSDAVTPNKVRIYNALSSNDQVSMFRIITSPANGIMNLTYLNPLTGTLASCDAWCPLLSSDDLKAAETNSSSDDDVAYFGNSTTIRWSSSYQEFAFVNEISVSDLTFMAMDSYGTNVAINGIQLYEEEFSTFANDTLNEPNCDSIKAYSHAAVSASSSWEGRSGYIYTIYDGSDELPYVNFYPNITYPGSYEINLYTPGCLDDNSCTSRPIVNVTVWDQSNSSILTSSLLYQNNDYEKYDSVFSGFLDSAPLISMTYHSAIYETESSNQTFVANKINVVVNAIYESRIDDYADRRVLNGLFQYEISNFTSNQLNSSSKVGNTSIDSYPVNYFSSGAELHAGFYNKSLLIGGSVGDIVQLSLDENLALTSNVTLNSTVNISGIYAYSDGLVLIESFNSVSNDSYVLSYNGSLNYWGGLPSNITSFNNITLDGTELLVFENEYIFNSTSEKYLSNSSALSMSLWSVGSNSLGSTLLFGAVSQNEYTNLTGSIYLNASESANTIGLPSSESEILYNAVYLNDTTNAYAFYSEDSSEGKYGIYVQNQNTTHQIPEEWSNPVSSMIYLKNESLLALGIQAATTGPQLYLRNLTANKTVADFTWNSNVSIDALIFFDKNDSVLVGGDFNVENVSCSGLCVFNYRRVEWLPFFSNIITGNVTSLNIYNDSTLLVSGNFETGNKTSVTLAQIDLDNGNSNIIIRSNDTIRNFVAVGNSVGDIVAQSDREIYHIVDGRSRSLTSSDFEETSTFNSVQLLPLDNSETSTLRKRSDSTQTLLVTGELYHKKYGNVSAMFYDGENWIPFLITNPKFSSSAITGGQMFSNKDDSSFFTSQTLLGWNSSSNSTSSSSSSSTTSSSTINSTNNPSSKEKKIDRGFVVLIGLALAVGTVAILGTIGVLLSYFIASNGKYQPLTPRIDESEMIETVPPEKLMKFI